MVSEEMLNDVVTSLQADTAGDFAAFSCISILLSVEKWEEVHLPGNNTALLDDVFHLIEFNTVVCLCTVDFELLLSFKSFTAFRARHLESGLKLDILVSINFHLLLMVSTVLLLSNLMLDSFSVSLKKFLAYEALSASTAFVAPLSFYSVVRAQT